MNTTIRSIDKISIAALNGVAVQTGLSLALSCDFRIASEAARLMSGTLRFGLLPDEGGQYLLVQHMGVAKTMDFLMLNRMVEADEALALGLVHEVVPADQLMDRSLALAGLFISVFYVAPPLQLKHHGWGEPAVALVWGPLMIGGGYYVATGTLPAGVLLASVPYALLVATVLFGKHIDKLDADSAKGIRTLPVILGHERSKTVARMLMISFFPLVLGLVAIGMVGPWPLLVVTLALSPPWPPVPPSAPSR